MLETSIFSISHNVFFPSQIKFQFWVTFSLSSANAFNLAKSKILSFGKGLREVTITKIIDLFKIQEFKWRDCIYSILCHIISMGEYNTILSAYT